MRPRKPKKKKNKKAQAAAAAVAAEGDAVQNIKTAETAVQDQTKAFSDAAQNTDASSTDISTLNTHKHDASSSPSKRPREVSQNTSTITLEEIQDLKVVTDKLKTDFNVDMHMIVVAKGTANADTEEAKTDADGRFLKRNKHEQGDEDKQVIKTDPEHGPPGPKKHTGGSLRIPKKRKGRAAIVPGTGVVEPSGTVPPSSDFAFGSSGIPALPTMEGESPFVPVGEPSTPVRDAKSDKMSPKTDISAVEWPELPKSESASSKQNSPTVWGSCARDNGKQRASPSLGSPKGKQTVAKDTE